MFGELLAAKVPPLTHADTEAIANFVLQAPGSGFAPLDFREVDRSYSLPGVSRFRASIFKQRGSWGAVMRTIPFAIPDFGTLNLPPAVSTVAEARRGLVLVTGATGNGKSTTIAAIINHIIQQERLHVVTVEDPIEFIFNAGKGLVIQREVGTDTASYSDALRAALRQDPDILMVGELRDRESADICLKAAETGHLVITSLHTPDVARAIGRVVGLFPSDEQETVRGRLADNLQAVVALRLLIRADAAGLIPAVEAMLATSTVREMIRDGARIKELRPYMETAGADLGMHSLRPVPLQAARGEADLARHRSRQRHQPGRPRATDPHRDGGPQRVSSAGLPPASRVLVVGADAEVSVALHLHLERAGFSLYCVPAPAEMEAMLRLVAPQVAVLLMPATPDPSWGSALTAATERGPRGGAGHGGGALARRSSSRSPPWPAPSARWRAPRCCRARSRWSTTARSGRRRRSLPPRCRLRRPLR